MLSDFDHGKFYINRNKLIIIFETLQLCSQNVYKGTLFLRDYAKPWLFLPLLWRFMQDLVMKAF